MKFGTAHGRSRPEVGSTKRIDVYGSGGVSWPYLVIDNSYHKITANTDTLGSIHNFYLLLVARTNIYQTAAKSHRDQC